MIKNFSNSYNFVLNKSIQQLMFLLALENISKNVDEINTGCGTFVDLQKVFDTAEHVFLLSKLEH